MQSLGKENSVSDDTSAKCSVAAIVSSTCECQCSFSFRTILEPGDAPTNITWSFDENDSLLIDWSRILYPNGNVTYILYLSNFVDRVSGPPVRIPQVPYNVNVTLQISAENEWGEGEKSTPVTFLTPHGGRWDFSMRISWFDTYVDIGEDLPAPENVTAYLRNSSLVVHIPLKHAYQNFIIYVRPESSEQYWKYEAVNVTEAQETIIIRHFPLDKNDR
ncbi:hypothetical protein NECAME_15677 [Necator americanus]|uniref:Fibronectin type-III domain-containing protein n=1 Tax=Necator americanus TaxID=51031 RepID=W2SIY5_NECAM|nr:hypothetical protein NECAME_15677 [Necator americanus]ETN68707.1 hypothetical protein NECAME_15677 [Necator americanus]